MKENLDNQDIQTENEAQQPLIEDLNMPEKKSKKEINFSIYNYTEKKLENYKLLNEEEILLCNEEAINEIKSKKGNKEEEIKIE